MVFSDRTYTILDFGLGIGEAWRSLAQQGFQSANCRILRLNRYYALPLLRSYRVHTTPLSPLNPPPGGDFEDRIGLEKSPRMGDLGGEKVCNEANLDLCVHRSLTKGGTEPHPLKVLLLKGDLGGSSRV